MLLKIYLGSTVFSWTTIYAGLKAMDARLGREGYRQVREPETQAEKNFDALKVTTFMLIPVINFIFALFVIFKYDELYEHIKKKGIDDGTIYKVSSDTEDSSQVEISLDLGKNKIDKLSYSTEEMIDWLKHEKENIEASSLQGDEPKVHRKHPGE